MNKNMFFVFAFVFAFVLIGSVSALSIFGGAGVYSTPVPKEFNLVNDAYGLHLCSNVDYACQGMSGCALQKCRSDYMYGSYTYGKTNCRFEGASCVCDDGRSTQGVGFAEATKIYPGLYVKRFSISGSLSGGLDPACVLARDKKKADCIADCNLRYPDIDGHANPGLYGCLHGDITRCPPDPREPDSPTWDPIPGKNCDQWENDCYFKLCNVNSNTIDQGRGLVPSYWKGQEAFYAEVSPTCVPLDDPTVFANTNICPVDSVTFPFKSYGGVLVETYEYFNTLDRVCYTSHTAYKVNDSGKEEIKGVKFLNPGFYDGKTCVTSGLYSRFFANSCPNVAVTEGIGVEGSECWNDVKERLKFGDFYPTLGATYDGFISNKKCNDCGISPKSNLGENEANEQIIVGSGGIQKCTKLDVGFGNGYCAVFNGNSITVEGTVQCVPDDSESIIIKAPTLYGLLVSNKYVSFSENKIPLLSFLSSLTWAPSLACTNFGLTLQNKKCDEKIAGDCADKVDPWSLVVNGLEAYNDKTKAYAVCTNITSTAEEPCPIPDCAQKCKVLGYDSYDLVRDSAKVEGTCANYIERTGKECPTYSEAHISSCTEHDDFEVKRDWICSCYNWPAS